MIRQCPECGEDLVELEPGAEMFSAAQRYRCADCLLTFETLAGAGLVEVND